VVGEKGSIDNEMEIDSMKINEFNEVLRKEEERRDKEVEEGHFITIRAS
jgi:hypothetical protein